MENKKNKTIELRRRKYKKLVLEKLKKMPIVSVACNRAGISRATYYRWITKDKDFQRNTNKAMQDGELFINDMSESQVVNLIKDKNWSAISFWLRHHHPKYTDKIKIEANIKSVDEELTPEQEKIVKKALKLASLDSQKGNKDDKSTQ